MAKKWYPVIDILSCVECGTCVNFCPHGVYDKKKSPVPVVVNSDGCIDHCHGCGCSANVEASAKRKLQIEYLYLDLNTCDRCIGTDAVLEEVIEMLRPALELAGYAVDYQKREMSTSKLAEQYHFLSSPTILVNGQDIFGTVQESNCGCCGEIAGVDVDCRIFEYEGKTYEVPTKEMLANVFMRAKPKEMEKFCPVAAEDDTNGKEAFVIKILVPVLIVTVIGVFC